MIDSVLLSKFFLEILTYFDEPVEPEVGTNNIKLLFYEDLVNKPDYFFNTLSKFLKLRKYKKINIKQKFNQTTDKSMSLRKKLNLLFKEKNLQKLFRYNYNFSYIKLLLKTFFYKDKL